MSFYYSSTTASDLLDSMLNTYAPSVSIGFTLGSSRKKGLYADGATIKDVIFNNPATIVKWSDGSKTVVKCQEGDTYNPELGLAMCVVKKCCGNKGNFNDVFKKWLPKEGASDVEKAKEKCL